MMEVEKVIEIQREIEGLTEELSNYDYIGTKIAMGVSTPEDYKEEIAHTEELRVQIRLLEEQIKALLESEV